MDFLHTSTIRGASCQDRHWSLCARYLDTRQPVRIDRLERIGAGKQGDVLSVERSDGDFRAPVRAVAHVYPPRLTADLTILDVLLRSSAAGIEGDFDGLPAIRTGDDCNSRHLHITRRKPAPNIVVAVVGSLSSVHAGT